MIVGLVLAFAAAAAAEPPAQPSPQDAAFKAEMIAFLERKGAKNPMARETADFLKTGVDVRVISGGQLAEWYGMRPGSMSAFYDGKNDILAFLDKPDDGIYLFESDGTVVRGERLGTALELLASIAVHEAAHVRVRRAVRWPSMGVIQNELYAHVCEARYLERELPLDGDLKVAAIRYRRFLRLKADGVRDGAPQFADARRDVDETIVRLGAFPVTMAAILAAYRDGPRPLAEYVRHLYAFKGYWNVYSDRSRRLKIVDQRIADAKSPALRESLAIERGFWSDPKRVATARRYFDKVLPEYRDLPWLRME